MLTYLIVQLILKQKNGVIICNLHIILNDLFFLLLTISIYF